MRAALGTLLFLVATWFIPFEWCRRGAERWFEGDPVAQRQLAATVERMIHAGMGRQDFSTGSSQFDGEWLFGTYLTAGFGYGQLMIAHPEWRSYCAEQMGYCIEQILTPEVRAFDRESWGKDALETLDGKEDHAAYLGYFNLLLGLHRRLVADSKFAALNDRITAALVRRIESSPTLLLLTYPGEMYPMDNCAVIGSIGMYDRATGADHRELIARWGARCRRDYLEPSSGLLYQAINCSTGKPIDAARASGSCLGLYFLAFSDPALSRQLFESVRRGSMGRIFRFGMVREYSASGEVGWGDIDSGPVVFGYGVSATGFFLSGCRMYGDREWFERLFATADLFGAPLERNGQFEFVTGGPLGNAILFAMLTALPPEKIGGPVR